MRTSIIIPEFGHPNFLEVCLKALFKNSKEKHDILIVGAIDAPATDFMYKSDRTRYQKWKTVREFSDDRDVKKWIEGSGHDVKFIDTTERRKEFMDRARKNGQLYEGGVDTAHNDNIGFEIANTEWAFWNWDDDFYACPNWDVNLFRYVDSGKKDRVYVPVHCQPAFNDSSIDPRNAWSARHISIHRLALPVMRSSDGTNDWILESEINEYVRNNSREGIWTERCSLRENLHWVPMLIRKELYQSIGCSDKGSGYDIEFDDKLGAIGVMKVMSRSSFIVHRSYTIFDQ